MQSVTRSEQEFDDDLESLSDDTTNDDVSEYVPDENDETTDDEIDETIDDEIEVYGLIQPDCFQKIITSYCNVVPSSFTNYTDILKGIQKKIKDKIQKNEKVSEEERCFLKIKHNYRKSKPFPCLFKRVAKDPSLGGIVMKVQVHLKLIYN